MMIAVAVVVEKSKEGVEKNGVHMEALRRQFVS